MLVCMYLLTFSVSAQNITKFEYFLDTDPGVGLATQVNVTPGTSFVDYSIPVSTSELAPGFHALYIRSQNELGKWTHTHFRTFFVDNTVVPPAISSFNPSAGLVGSTVVITGTNFSTVPANNTVRFNGTAATVTVATSTSLTVTVPDGATSGLISVVVSDLTATSSSSFTVLSPNITALEYFFNTDPGPGNGTAVTITPGTTIDLANIDIPTTSLAVGWHTVHVRTRDANNMWGFYESRRVYVREPVVIDPIEPPPPITQAEFFYDTDNGPGSGTPITITPSETIDLVNENLSNTLAEGWHTIAVRTKNDDNVWGFYETRRIFVRGPTVVDPVEPSPIVELEWFVDSDPGAGLSPTKLIVSPTTLIDLVDQPLDIGVQTLGAHRIYVRAKNEDGVWSMSEPANFTVATGCSIMTAPSATGVNRCDPGSVTINASGAIAGETYRWYATNTSNTPLFAGSPYNTPSISVSTTYYVSIYNPTTYCESGRTPVTASVDGIPKPSLNITGSLTVCEGTTQVLTAPPGFVTYTWSNGLTTQQITATTTGAYSVVVNNGVCSSPPSDAFTFTVDSRPAKPTITSTNGGTLCGVSSVTLSGPVGLSGYSWSTGGTTQDINVSSVGSFALTVTNGAGCQSVVSDPFVVTSGSISKPTISVTGNLAVCPGGDVTLEAPSGFANYTWSTGATSQGITVSTAGSYSVVVGNGGCTSPSSDPTIVTSLSTPAQPTIQVTGSTSICTGSFVGLTAPSGFNNYLWSNGETSRQIVVATAGDFTVQVGNAVYCMSIASNVVTTTLTGQACGGTGFQPPPPPAVVNGSSCGAGTAVLTAGGAAAGMEYRWYDAVTGGTLLGSSASFTTPSISQSTDFYAAVYDPVTLTESIRTKATASIIIITKPSLSPAASIALCAGSSTLISGPVGYVAYQWRKDGVLLSSVSQQIAVTSAGSYTVEVGDGNCLSMPSDPIAVTVDTMPAKPVITGVHSICGAGTVTLTSSSGSQYLWSTNETTQSVSVSAGTFTVSVLSGTCSSVSDQFVVSQLVVPAKPVLPAALSLCEGTSTRIEGPTGYAVYTWTKDGIALPQVSQQIQVTGAGSYSVRVGDGTCMSQPADAMVVTVGVKPAKPSISGDQFICGSGTVTLTAPAASAYLWSTGETSQSIIVPSGSYTVNVSNGTCSTSSDTFVVTTASIPGKPVVSVTGKEVICVGSLVALSAPPGFANYLWSTGETTQIILVDDARSYSVQVGNAPNCLSAVSDARQVRIGTVAECGVIPSPTNKAPAIAASSFGVQIRSEAIHELVSLISDEDNNLDSGSLQIIDQPSANGKASGGKAILDVDNKLVLDYRGINFAGKEYFVLRVCDLEGLCVQKELEVDVVGEVQVYNGVTPDGDGINDFMLIEFIDIIEGARENSVIIMNRWGSVVFEMSNYNNDDRVFVGLGNNGQELPGGTYYYKVSLASGQTQTGYMILKR